MLAVAQDAPFFVYDMLTGDVSVTAKIKSISGTTADSLAGVMIRQTLDPGSIFAAIAKSGVTSGRNMMTVWYRLHVRGVVVRV